MSKVISDWNTKNRCQTSDKIIKLNSNIYSDFIYIYFNYWIDKGEFPNELKHADIIPIYKKKTNAKKKTIKL